MNPRILRRVWKVCVGWRMKWLSWIVILPTTLWRNAGQLGARVFIRDFDGFGAQKQFALDQTTGDWVLSIDADERVTPALADEIRQALIRSNPEGSRDFEVRRNFYFLGKRLRFGGVGGDWVLRLFPSGSRPFPSRESA